MLSEKAFNILNKDLFQSGQILLGEIKRTDSHKGQGTLIEVIGKGYSYIHEATYCKNGKLRGLKGAVIAQSKLYPLSTNQLIICHRNLLGSCQK